MFFGSSVLMRRHIAGNFNTFAFVSTILTIHYLYTNEKTFLVLLATSVHLRTGISSQGPAPLV